MKQFAAFKTFQELHHQSAPFLLPNAWDAASARVFQRTGYKAIGTTSAGIAMSLGYADGENLPFETLLVALKTIVDSVDIPVSADIEAGYGTSPEEISENVRKVVSTGVVGINIEDGTGSPGQPLRDASLQADAIAAVRQLDLPFSSMRALMCIGLNRRSRFPLSISRQTGEHLQRSGCRLHIHPRS